MSQQVLMRLVFRTRYGKVDELVGLMKKNEYMAAAMAPGWQPAETQWRHLIDHASNMFHVVTEMLTTVENLSRWTEAQDTLYRQVEFKVWFNQMLTCTEAGSRELYRVHVTPQNFSSAQGRVAARIIFQARYGKADAVVEHFSRESALAQKLGIPPAAIYTDMTGPMFTVVSSRDFASLADWEQAVQRVDALPELAEWRRQLLGMVEMGRREFFRIV